MGMSFSQTYHLFIFLQSLGHLTKKAWPILSNHPNLLFHQGFIPPWAYIHDPTMASNLHDTCWAKGLETKCGHFLAPLQTKLLWKGTAVRSWWVRIIISVFLFFLLSVFVFVFAFVFLMLLFVFGFLALLIILPAASWTSGTLGPWSKNGMRTSTPILNDLAGWHPQTN